MSELNRSTGGGREQFAELDHLGDETWNVGDHGQFTVIETLGRAVSDEAVR